MEFDGELKRTAYVIGQVVTSRLRVWLPAVPFLIGWVGFTVRTFASLGWRPFHGTDFETPIYPLYYILTLVQPWNPLSLGSFRNPSNLDLVYGLVALASPDSRSAQLVLLTLIPLIGYAGTYILTVRQFKLSRWAASTGAFVFAFSPAYLAWFTLPYMLGFAVMPWYFLALFALLRELLGDDPDRYRLSFLAVSFAFVSSLLTSTYFQNAPLLLFASVLALGVVFVQERPAVDQDLLRSASGVILAFVACFLVSFSRLVFLLQYTGGQESGTAFLTVPMVQSFYENANPLNILTLSGGTPGNEQFEYMQGDPLGLLVPLMAFSGLFVVHWSDRDRRIVGCYYYVLVLALVSVGIAQAMRALSAAGNPVVTHVLLAGFRRPERLLEALAFFYALGVAFSVDGLGHAIDEYRPKLAPVTVREHAIPSLVVVVLVGSMLFTGLVAMPHSDRSDQQVTPRPAASEDVQEFLETEPTRAYDSTYRYAMYPMYSPLYSYLRYNYPALLYADGYSSLHVRETVSTGNRLLAQRDEAFALTHSLASVRTVAVIPDEYATDEHQAWRLRGGIRRSGVSMFGNPSRYREFFGRVEGYERTGRESLAVYRNERALERVYVAEAVVEVNDTDAKGYRRAYVALNQRGWPDRFVLVENESLGDNEVRLSRFDRATTARYEFENVTEADLNVNGSQETARVSNTIVWSDSFDRSIEKGRRVVRNGENGTERLSLWVDLQSATVNLSEEVLTLGFETNGSDASGLSYSLLSDQGELVSALFDANSSSVGNGTDVTLRVVPDNRSYRYLRITGDVPPGGEVIVNDTVSVQQVNDVSIHDPSIESLGCANVTLYSAESYDSLGSACQVETPYEFYANLTTTRLLLADRSPSRKWRVESSNVSWRSPDHVRISATINASDADNRIRVPVVFSNSYNERWMITPRVEDADVENVTHKRANGYANAWMLRLDDVRSDKVTITADVRIRRGYLLIYWLRSLGAVAVPAAVVGLFVLQRRRET